MRSASRVRVVVTFLVVIALAAGGAALLLFTSVNVLNGELFGRITETHTVAAPFSKSADDPVVRLVIHRVVPDENAVEASILLVVDTASHLGKEIRGAGVTAKAVVEDGSSPHLFAMHAETPEITAETFQSGRSDAVARSERFYLPMFPSMGSYPFDDLRLRPMFQVRTNRGALLAFKTEVQKALPGRLLTVSGDSLTVLVRLSRTAPEKGFILTASVVFLLLSVAVTVGLFLSPHGLSNIEQILAVAGYLLAAAGFRELLGVARIAGTTILEIVILGIPLVLLSFGFAISIYRGARVRGDQPAEMASK